MRGIAYRRSIPNVDASTAPPMRILILDQDFYGANTLAIRAEASGYAVEIGEARRLAADVERFDPDVVLMRLDDGPALGRHVREVVQRTSRRAGSVMLLGHVGDRALVSQRCAHRAAVDDIGLTPVDDAALVAMIEVARIRHVARRFSLA